MNSSQLTPYYEALRRYPPVLSEAFEAALQDLNRLGDATLLVRWAEEGVRVAQRSARAWEAAAEYFRASPQALQALNFTQLLRWGETGAALCQDSATVGAAFFRASPMALPNLPPRYIGGWAALGRSLSKGTWKSSTLAARFFDASPGLLQSMGFKELEAFVSLLEALSRRSYDLASECLLLGQRVLPSIQERMEMISLAQALAASSWREVKGSFEAVGKINASIAPGYRARFLTLAERLARNGMTNVSGFIVEMAGSLAHVPGEHQGRLLEQAESLAGQSAEAVASFLKSMPRVLERVSLTQLDTWFQEGASLLRENVDSGVAYFKLESSRAEHLLDALSSSIELEKVKGLLGLYGCALVGSVIELMPVQQLANKKIGWVSTEQATTDGRYIYLPPVVDYLQRKEDNFAWVKVVTTHQLGHLEFGSFAFEMEKPATLFEDLRFKLLDQAVPSSSSITTDMARFFDLFVQRQLSADIFSVVEDARVDGLLQRRYRGLAPSYRWVQTGALQERPSIEELPVQQAMVELLVRLSLDISQQVPVPLPYVQQAHEVAGIFRRVQSAPASVEDTAEATIRIYAIISALPNDEVPPEDWDDQRFDDSSFDEGDNQKAISQILQEKQADQTPSEGYESPQNVDFRGDFKPEMVQLLTLLRGMEEPTNEEEQQALSQEALEELLRATTELQFDAEGEVVDFAANMMKEQGVDLPPTQPGAGYQDTPHIQEEGGALEAQTPRSYVYDEWDFRANDYRPRWCVVQERQVLTGETRFYSETLQTHAHLMNQIRRQFETVKPEMLRKVKHLPEGEDVDIDQGIDALIDIRSGVAPNEEIYWRRNKAERDVGVVFLLDMSASTAEAVEEAKRDAEWDLPNDPAAYAAWLRARRSEGGRRHYKRIIDVEKESMVLLMTALDTIGDRYGVYGFSGFGRENVEFYIIKDVEETLSDRVKGRLDKVSPLHATRMGPAIRHATSKLEKVNAKTKFLFVISDGRPQDRGYSREGVEKEYAVQDTRMALLEARRKDITPFCLTVDRQGHDYLKTMAGDMGYEVLPDVNDLPRRLPQLYRRITH